MTAVILTMLLVCSGQGPAENAPPELNEAEARLFQRLRPHFERVAQDRVNERLQRLAKEIGEADPTQPNVQAGPEGVLLGAVFAAAIFALVKKVIATAVVGAIGSILLIIVWAYWPYILGGWLAGVVLPAWLAGGAAGRRSR